MYHFCRDKYLSRQTRYKSKLVATKLLSRQNYVLSQQAYFLSRHTRVCFVATKMILVAAPANDGIVGVAFNCMLYSINNVVV